MRPTGSRTATTGAVEAILVEEEHRKPLGSDVMCYDDDHFVSFPSTAWTCVRIAQDSQHPEHVQAMNRLAELYCKPVFCFFRACGLQRQDAADRTQGFFAEFLEREKVKPADPNRGRFRDYLKRLCRNFLSDEMNKPQPEFERRLKSLDALLEQEGNFEPSGGETPEEVLDRIWNACTLAEALDRLRQLLTARGNGVYYDIFMDSLEDRQKVVAERFEMSRYQVRDIVAKVKRLLRRLLRDLLTEEGIPEEQIEEVIREMMRIGFRFQD
jgi:RNA polymerase sigma-70 factor (ECF subfamily)